MIALAFGDKLFVTALIHRHLCKSPLEKFDFLNCMACFRVLTDIISDQKSVE